MKVDRIKTPLTENKASFYDFKKHSSRNNDHFQQGSVKVFGKKVENQITVNIKNFCSTASPRKIDSFINSCKSKDFLKSHKPKEASATISKSNLDEILKSPPKYHKTCKRIYEESKPQKNIRSANSEKKSTTKFKKNSSLQKTNKDTLTDSYQYINENLHFKDGIEQILRILEKNKNIPYSTNRYQIGRAHV